MPTSICSGRRTVCGLRPVQTWVPIMVAISATKNSIGATSSQSTFSSTATGWMTSQATTLSSTVKATVSIRR